MTGSERFAPGTRIELREMWRGRVWTSRPVTVVRDDHDEIVLEMRVGTTFLYPAGPQHGEHTLHAWLRGEWELVPRAWEGSDILRIARPGAPFDVWVVPGEPADASDLSARDGWYSGAWYVNLQEPLRRTEHGFDTMDHVLDIVVARDLSTWSYKDEAEFARAVELGVFSTEEAAQIWSDAGEVVARIRTGDPPWNRAWGDPTGRSTPADRP
ncbi:MAG TPA: DUF402 domain-containing protein [Acidimicrobiia bacterium]|nr:DUF402 domain-containing protein [Acidimicrobiia bacterium]